MIKTRVTEMLGVEYPIVQAPMGWIARAQLASAVSNAGGLGIIETSSGDLPAVREEVKQMRRFRTPAKGKDGNHARAARPLPQLPLRLRSTFPFGNRTRAGREPAGKCGRYGAALTASRTTRAASDGRAGRRGGTAPKPSAMSRR